MTKSELIKYCLSFPAVFEDYPFENGDGGVIELINPVITELSEETQEVMEGSIAPGAPRGTVIRPKSVTISALDRNGNPITVSGSDFLAATFCHEIDHLDGILFTDKANKTEG
jgi:peptide deformylase